MHELLRERERLLAFARSRVADPDVAEDLLQDSLLKALQAAPKLHDRDRLVTWFYRILRNTIIDYYRRRDARTRHEIQLAAQPASAPDADERRAVCACLSELIASLKPEYRELIEQLDLAETDAATVAQRIGISRNNLKVRRHRARVALRERLERTCRMCAEHGCMDCACKRTAHAGRAPAVTPP